MQNNFSRYNDGVISLYREKPRLASFNAKQNADGLADLEFVVKLDYEECAKREQDLEFARQNDFTLSLKVKTRFVNNIDNKCKAVINGYLYDVSSVDKSRTELYLFLEGVKQIDT